MIWDMGNRIGAGAGVLALAVLVGCQAEEETTSAAADASAEAEPATLGSMDEQYAWVGDLGTGMHCPANAVHRALCRLSRSTSLKAPHTTWLEPDVSAGAVSVDHRGHHAPQAAHL